MSDVVDRLAAHRALEGVPRVELEWLASHGKLRAYRAGELASAKGSPIDELFIMLAGRVVSAVKRPSGRRDTLESRGGDVTALLPFSRMTTALGDTHAVEDSEALAVHRDLFPEMLRECPAVVERLVHFMLDRARHFSTSTLQDEQLQSLGRLAAGLAHELNNPASAAARSSHRLRQALSEAGEAASAFGAAQPTPEQRAAVQELLGSSPAHVDGGVSAVERAEREEDIARWLEAHSVPERLAEPLAESAVTVASLERLAATASGPHLAVMLRRVAADLDVAALAREVEHAADRIHGLVSAMKRFTNLDRAVAPGPMNVAQGLADTVTLLAMKARAKSVAVALEVEGELPPVTAGDELNQVWLHLLDNAIDAAREAGEVRVRAAVEHDELVVRVVDDGPGIAPEIAPRIFDPFFTTKPPGKGTGLGLDIVRRVLAVNDGHVGVEAAPGRTEFRVSMPVAAASGVSPRT
jgi:signal transduction histidine kinase